MDLRSTGRYTTDRAERSDGTYSPRAVARHLLAAVDELGSIGESSADYDLALGWLTAAARAAGPGRLSERITCLRDCLQAEADGEEPAEEHDYRADLSGLIAALAGLS